MSSLKNTHSMTTRSKKQNLTNCKNKQANTDLKLGTRIEVCFTPNDKTFKRFYSGTITNKSHVHGVKYKYFIEYDDGDTSWIDLSQKTWNMLPSSNYSNKIETPLRTNISIYSIKHYREITGLSSISIMELINSFLINLSPCDNTLREFAQDSILKEEYDYVIDKCLFNQPPSPEAKTIFNDIFNLLSEITPTEPIRVLKLTRLYSAFSTLCQGDLYDKTKSVFDILDYSRKGYLTKDEFTDYLLTIFLLLFHCDSSLSLKMGVSAEELAVITSDSLFNDLGQEKLTFSKLEEWYTLP